MRVSAQYAEAHMGELLEATYNGEQVEIAAESKPAVRLVLVPRPNGQKLPLLGLAKGKFWIADDFDSPEVNAEIAAEFEGSELFPR